jgi:uncharacterized membrane protein required for colicin V production
LTYWIIFGLFTLINDFFGWILDLIPYFSILKVAFFMYMLLPQFKGALTIYNKVAKPLLDQYRPEIEKLINDVQGVAKDAIKEAKTEAIKKASDPTLLLKGAQYAAQAEKTLQEIDKQP